ncbi:polymorphic toxin type 24 domain-containing protein [Nocardia mexicana]|uniref:Putative RNase toxin 24 of polymorphic toxin system n=1 Tax=Nocardia mexicana TaxID=279262 RepID=A0A370GSE7_9NOCA|nr:polymorphic toxin type 24 domain-containing protein [Nocardia mexicana]RDI46617.1 putative RNase toxin 24 of polymorphic toxin system [Nocardia mexicana]
MVDDGFELASKVGIPIPDGDPGKLLAAADTWNALAANEAVANLPAKLEGIAQNFQAVTAPEVEFIDEDIREMKSAAEDLITTLADLANSCREQKTAIDALRADLQGLLQDLAADIATEVATTVVFSVVAGALSAGFGAAAVTAYKTGKIAKKVKNWADRIGGIVQKAKLLTAVKVQKSTATSRQKMQRIIDLVKKHGDDVKKAPGKSLREKLDNAQTTTDRRITIDNGPPNGYIVKRDANGNITNYVQFDQNGRGIKRVDLTGRPHAGVQTPHVVEMDHNVAPDGRVFVREQRDVRPAALDEIP